MTSEEQFRNSLADLTGKVAIVTGGAEGIGFETTCYLATQGATVYVATFDDEITHQGIENARKRLHEVTGLEIEEANSRVRHHALDLGSVATAWNSAKEFKKTHTRLDILVCNAGVAMTNMTTLSPDGFDLAFSTNHIGNFVFTISLLDLIKSTADKHDQDSRIVWVCSLGYKSANKLDYEYLKTTIPDDGKRLMDVVSANQRYWGSKLAMAHATIELSRRIRRIGILNVYLNACHPGNAMRTRLGKGHQAAVGPVMEEALRTVLEFSMGTTTKDSAKTSAFLAGNDSIKNKGIHGTFWIPQWTLLRRSYKDCMQEEWTELARNQKEIHNLWEVTVETLKSAVYEEELLGAEIIQEILKVPFGSEA